MNNSKDNQVKQNGCETNFDYPKTQEDIIAAQKLEKQQYNNRKRLSEYNLTNANYIIKNYSVPHKDNGVYLYEELEGSLYSDDDMKNIIALVFTSSDEEEKFYYTLTGDGLSHFIENFRLPPRSNKSNSLFGWLYNTEQFQDWGYNIEVYTDECLYHSFRYHNNSKDNTFNAISMPFKLDKKTHTYKFY